MPTDEQVAAWATEQNRGVPAWDVLSASTRAWWRDRYAGAAAQLNGTPEAAVMLMTGLTAAEIEALGGLPPESA